MIIFENSIHCQANQLIHIVNNNEQAFISWNESGDYANFWTSGKGESYHDDLAHNVYDKFDSEKVSNFIHDDKLLDLNNHKSINDIRPVDSCDQIINSKHVSEPQSVYLRKDIVNKAIIRALNKFYNESFKYKTCYRGKSKEKLYEKFTSHIAQAFESHPINFN